MFVCGDVIPKLHNLHDRVMASFLRPILTRARPQSRAVVTSSRMEKVLENLKENPYLDKYAAKIALLQKTSPDELKQRLQEQEKTKTKPKLGTVDTRQYSSVLNPKESLKTKKEAHDKPLDSIIKIDLVKDKVADEIKKIWVEYHSQKEVIAATIPNNVYEKIKESMRKYPTFILPLPRSQGYEFIMCQSLHNTVHFTPLLAFQVHKENAPECLTMVHYTELSDKGIILMRGEYDKNSLNAKEAQCLANQFQLYYNAAEGKKKQLLESFTLKPDEFKHMEVISELENLSIQ